VFRRVQGLQNDSGRGEGMRYSDEERIPEQYFVGTPKQPDCIGPFASKEDARKRIKEDKAYTDWNIYVVSTMKVA
jgi:hypothetical protein